MEKRGGASPFLRKNGTAVFASGFAYESFIIRRNFILIFIIGLLIISLGSVLVSAPQPSGTCCVQKCVATDATTGAKTLVATRPASGCGSSGCSSKAECSDCQDCIKNSPSDAKGVCTNLVINKDEKNGVQWSKPDPNSGTSAEISGKCCAITTSSGGVSNIFFRGLTSSDTCPECTASFSDSACKCYECYESSDPNIPSVNCPAGMKCENGKCIYNCEKDDDCNKPPVDKSKAPKICKNHQCVNAECGYDCSIGIFVLLGQVPECKNPMYTREFRNTIEGCLNSMACVNGRCQACNCNDDCKYTYFDGQPATFCTYGKCLSHNQLSELLSGFRLDSSANSDNTGKSCPNGVCPVSGDCKNCPCPYLNQKKDINGKCVCTKKNQEIKNPDINGYGPCECKDNSLKLDENGECVCKSERSCYSGSDNEYTCKCPKSSNNIQMIKNLVGDCTCPANMVEIGGTDTSIGTCICKNGGGDPANNCQVNSVGKTCFKIRTTTFTQSVGYEIGCPPSQKTRVLHNCQAWTCSNYGGENACGAEKAIESQSGSMADANAGQVSATGTLKMKCGEWSDGCGGTISCGTCSAKYICRQEVDGSQSVYKIEGYCKMSKSASGEITGSDCVYDSASLSASEKPTRVKINECGQCGYCMYNPGIGASVWTPVSQISLNNPEGDSGFDSCSFEEDYANIGDSAGTGTRTGSGTGSSGGTQTFQVIETTPTTDLIICTAKAEDTPCQGQGEKLCCGLQSPYVCKSASTSSTATTPAQSPTLSPGQSMANQPSQTATSTSSSVNMKCVKQEVSVPGDCEKCDMKEEMKKVGEDLKKQLCDKIKQNIDEEIDKFKLPGYMTDGSISNANVDSYITLVQLTMSSLESKCNIYFHDPNTKTSGFDPLIRLNHITNFLSKYKTDPRYKQVLILKAGYYQNFEMYEKNIIPNNCINRLSLAEDIYDEAKKYSKSQSEKDQIDNMLATLYIKGIVCHKVTGHESHNLYLHAPEMALQTVKDENLRAKIKTNILNMMILEIDNNIKSAKKEIQKAFPYTIEEFNQGDEIGIAMWAWRWGDYYFYHMPETRNMYNCLFGWMGKGKTREISNKEINEKVSLILTYRDGFVSLRDLLNGYGGKVMDEFCFKNDVELELSYLNKVLNIGLSKEDIKKCMTLTNDYSIEGVTSTLKQYTADSGLYGRCYKLLVKRCNAKYACDFSDVKLINNNGNIDIITNYGETKVNQFKFMGVPEGDLGYDYYLNSNKYQLKVYPYNLYNEKEKADMYKDIYYVNFFTVSKNAVMAYGFGTIAGSIWKAGVSWRGAAIVGEFAGFMKASEYVTKYFVDLDPQSGEFAADIVNLGLLPVAIKGAKIIAEPGVTGISPPKKVYGWYETKADFLRAIKGAKPVGDIIETENGAFGEFIDINTGSKIRVGYGNTPKNIVTLDISESALKILREKYESCKKQQSVCKAKNNGETPAVCEASENGADSRIPYKPLEEVMSPNFDPYRIAYAEEVLGKLSKEQIDAIWEAHEAKSLKQKMSILQKSFDRRCQIIELLKRGICGKEDLTIKGAVDKIRNILEGKGFKNNLINENIGLFEEELKGIINSIRNGEISEGTNSPINAIFGETDLSGRTLEGFRYIIKRSGNHFSVSLEHKGITWIIEGSKDFTTTTKLLSKEILDAKIKLKAGTINPEKIMGSPDGVEYLGVRLDPETVLLFEKIGDTYELRGIAKAETKISLLFNYKCEPVVKKLRVEILIDDINSIINPKNPVNNLKVDNKFQTDSKLRDLAKRIGPDDLKDIENNINQFVKGQNPSTIGIGGHPIPGTSFSELRARDGARVYYIFDHKTNTINIIGLSNKQSQGEVINRLKSLGF